MNQPRKEESLHNKIASWLETQGYDTQMKTALALHNSGLEPIQSLYYQDPETNNPREIDVVTRLHDRIGLIYVYPIIECKKSEKPWVAFTSTSGFNRVTSFSVTAKETRFILAHNIVEMNTIDWFKKDGRIAHGITEAFTSREDETFKAGISATKAAIALSQNESFSGTGLSFFFPTVVLNGKLFECYLDEKGDSILGEIDSVFLEFNLKFGDHLGSSVHIVTLDAFDKYCRELKSTFSQLKQILKKERKEVAIKLSLNPDVVDEYD